MIERTAILVAIAISTFVLPVVFLVLLGIGWRRRSGGRPVGRRLENLLAFIGGASLGSFVPIALGIILISLPIFVVPIFVVVGLWRRRRRRLAGLVVAGFAAPLAVLWTYFGALVVTGEIPFVLDLRWAQLPAGIGLLLLGLAMAAQSDPPSPAPAPSAAPGEPGSRRIGTIAAAIMEPTRVGPFRVSDIAALIGLIIPWFVIELLPIPDRFVKAAIAAVVSSVVASEAYIRAMPTRSRLAFEAFSWLGESEIARLKVLVGGSVPTNRKAAEAWLAKTPESPLTDWARAETLILAERPQEALAVVDRMPVGTPAERFERASTMELVEWANGRTTDTGAMEALLGDLGPEGSDARLQGEVAIAAVKVRHAMDAGHPADGDVLEPLLAVRERLGDRADGQVGRALRKRMIPIFLIFGLLFAMVTELLGGVVEGLRAGLT